MAGGNMAYMPKGAVKVGYMPKGAVPVKPEGESLINKIIQGETLPNAGQAIAGVASLPVSAPLSVVNPMAGKALRTGIGTLGRVGGEIVRGGAEDLQKLLTNAPGNQRQEAVARGERMAKEAAIGAGSEAVGEFFIGPAVNYTLESIVSPLLKSGAGLMGKAAYKATDLPLIRTIRDLAVSTTKSAAKFPNEIRTRAANTFLGLDSSKSVLKTAEGKDINIGESFLEDTRNFGWNGIDRNSVLKQVKNTMKSVGKKLEAAENKVTEKIKIGDLGTQVRDQYEKLLKTAPDVAEDYLNKIGTFIQEHPGGVSFRDAQAIKETFDKISHTAGGGLTKSSATNGEVMAQNDIANFLRNQLHSNKYVSEYLQQWERMKLYRDSLAGVKPPVFPKNFNPSQLIMSPVQNQEFLTRQINRPGRVPLGNRFEALERSIGQAATPYIGSAVLNR